MINEYRFFQEFFDGQIVKKDSDKYKFFKIVLFSAISTIGIFLYLMGWCTLLPVVLLEVGMIWNFYSGLSRKISYFLCIIVAFGYFYICSKYAFYSNALIYVACYIPFQLIANGKDYSEGDFVQIKKTITDLNKILFVVFFVILIIFLSLISYDFGSRFIILDVLSASLLVCSALLRNERYLEYYIFRIFALLLSISLWIIATIEYNSIECIVIALMYISYLIFDISNFVIQNKTYVNEYMLQVERHNKLANQALVNEKLKLYNSKNKNKEL